MITNTSSMFAYFTSLSKEEQVKLVQLFVSHLAGTSSTKEKEYDLAEEPHFTYKASIPVLSKDWDQPEDEHWDNY